MLAPLPFEIAFSHAVQGFVSPALTSLMIAFTWLGSPTVWIGLAMGLYWLNHKRLAMRIMVLTIVAEAVVGGLKLAFARPRPGSEFLQLYGDGIVEKSFPSGHATLVSTQVMHLLKREQATEWFSFMGMILVLGVGISRIYLGLHYLGDVVAGVVIGTLIGWIFWKAHENARVQALKEAFAQWKYEFLVLVLALIGIALMLTKHEVGAIAATLGFIVGYLLFEEDEDMREEPLPFEGLHSVKVILGLMSTALFVLLNWQLVGSVEGYGVISFVVYLFAGIYAVALFPRAWDYFVHAFSPRKKIRTR